MLSKLGRAWTMGWAVSRGTPPPVEEPWGVRIDVGRPRQIVRHVLLDPTEPTVRKLAESIATPATWLKSAVAPDLIAPYDAAVREVREETGYEIEIDELLGMHTRVTPA